jgi:hypothetical protein
MEVVRRLGSTKPTAASGPARRCPTTDDQEATVDAHSSTALDDSDALVVIVDARDFRLPSVLRWIEAGKTVLVISQHD